MRSSGKSRIFASGIDQASEPRVAHQRTWVPPALTALSLSATSNVSGPDADMISPTFGHGPRGIRPDPQPRPPRSHSPRPVDHLPVISDASPSPPPGGKAGVAPELEQRTWVPPAVTTLRVSATGEG